MSQSDTPVCPRHIKMLQDAIHKWKTEGYSDAYTESMCYISLRKIVSLQVISAEIDKYNKEHAIHFS